MSKIIFILMVVVLCTVVDGRPMHKMMIIYPGNYTGVFVDNSTGGSDVTWV